MQSLEAVLRRVAGRCESSQMAGGRTRRRRGEAILSVPPLDEDASMSQMTRRSGRSSRRTRGPRARSPSPEDEEEQEQEQDQEEDQQEQEEEDQE